VLSATMRGIFILLGGVLLGAEITFSVAALLPVALLIAATLSLGLIAAGVTLVVKRGEPISASVHVINGLLAGVLYPVSVLPTWLQTIADWVPLTHALALLRSAILPQTTSPPSHHLAVLAVMTAVLSVLAVLFFSRALTRAKRKGTLSHY
jgi:ABC-2 type transport system permease protein